MLNLTVLPKNLTNSLRQTAQIRDGSVTVTVARAGANARTVAVQVLAKLGLSGQTLARFNQWAKTDFLQDATNQLARQLTKDSFRQGTGAGVSLKVVIKADLIKWLQEFGLNFNQAQSGEFSGSGDGGIGGGNSNNKNGAGDGTAGGGAGTGSVDKNSEAYKKVERQWVEVESTASVFSTRLINDQTVRKQYQDLIKAMSNETMANFEKGLLTEYEAAQLANQARNKIMEAQRLTTSDLGNAFAKWQKASGKTLLDLQNLKAKKFGKPFAELTELQQKEIWLSIVKSAGKDSEFWSKFAKWGGRAGKAFVVVTVAIAVWNIAQSENKVDATLKEGASVGGAFLGAAIGGWAGAVCGPGAVICVPLGIFVGGIVGGYLGEVIYEGGRDTLIGEPVTH